MFEKEALMFGVELVLTSFSAMGLPDNSARHEELRQLLQGSPTLEVGASGLEAVTGPSVFLCMLGCVVGLEQRMLQLSG
jgi:hypothetical protein